MPTSTAVPQPANGPKISEVARRTPDEVVALLRGRLADYPGSSAASVLDFSPSDIVETMDTVVLEQVKRQRGAGALQQVVDVIARAILATLREQYGDRWLLVPLEAGHGGKKGFSWDPGSEGTEAEHTRAVVAAMLRLATAPEYAHMVLRRIHDDDIADDFGLPTQLDKSVVNRVLMRQARASMLAAEAVAWNEAQSTPTTTVLVHEISVHFNAGSGGALVLHQGPPVRPEFVARSLDFGRRYLQRVTTDLNATGLLPILLRPWGGNGLHDDVMMYRPDYLSDDDIRGITLRYGALQGPGYLPRYVEVILGHAATR